MAEIELQAYQDEAVLQPGQGGVFHNEVGAEPPTLEEIRAWVEGDRTKGIGTSWTPTGYTSIEELPKIGSETEGGEKKGVWENPSFKTSPIVTTDTISVQPVQWSVIPIQMRFGAGAKHDPATGKISIPQTYTPVEVSLLVVFLDGDTPLVIHYYKASSSPDGDLEPDREEFLALPVKFTVLNAPGKTDAGNIMAYHLQTADADSDGIPDVLDDDESTGV